MGKFERDFWLGAATAAHQVEGDNIHSDYWVKEHMRHSGFAEPSLDAVDHYNRYESDIKLMADAGLNAYHFSIEWARIEPQCDRFDDGQIEHYRRVIACCRENGLEPIVTLLYFSSPAWLIKKGGWEAETTVDYFARYVRYVAECLGGQLKCICTMSVNMPKRMESQRYAGAENLKNFGTVLPQMFTSGRSAKGDIVVMKAHQAARAEIKTLYPAIQVGLTLPLNGLWVKVEGRTVESALDDELCYYLPHIREDDFLGIQSGMKSVENAIRRAADLFSGKLIVTGNGIATDDDRRREAFIDAATDGVASCIRDGIPVKGYFYRSFLDCFEWKRGYSMACGLVAVDRAGGQKRTPKPSLAFLGGLR